MTTTCGFRAHLCILTLATLTSGCVAMSLSLGDEESGDDPATTSTATEGSSGATMPDPSGGATTEATGGAMTDTGVGETDEPMPDLPVGGGDAGSCCMLPGESQGPGEPPPGCEDPEIEACVCAVFPSCCDESWDDSCVFLAADSCGAGCTAQICNCDPFDADSCDGGRCIFAPTEQPMLMCSYPPAMTDADGELCDSNVACAYGSLCAPPSAVPTCAGEDGLGCCTPTCDLDAPSCLEGQSCVPMLPGGSGCAQNLGICTAGDQEWWLQ